MTRISGIIPARYGSTRFPGKPLVSIMGKSMIQRVYEQACLSSSLDEVIIATDDERIVAHVNDFGGKVVMTSSDHASGTDRCAEVAGLYALKSTHIINIQGDEPFIDPAQIDLLVNVMQRPEVGIGTLVKAISDEQSIRDPNTVKAVLDAKGRAIYFSRSPIPYRRNQAASITYYKHIGIYGYTRNTLLAISKLPAGQLEVAESLEQLRWIEAGFPIMTGITDKETVSIDSPSDLERVEKMMKS